ncbi:unnamed protein product [Echinostoma caproni]|uniref:MLVIN_C domain-containing protein n=1 Tax=Echinostoma caproni TaxID=27848 RepID=A0A183BCC4_9TREM|nr:unnamed protein product [Echinostoma caproni]
MRPPTRCATPHVRRMQANLTFGHHLARQHLQSVQRHQKSYFDRRVKQRTFLPGDRVWLSESAPPTGVPAKLHRAWKGPYLIEQVLFNILYRLTLPQWSVVVHVNRLKNTNNILDSAEDSASLRGGRV